MCTRSLISTTPRPLAAAWLFSEMAPVRGGRHANVTIARRPGDTLNSGRRRQDPATPVVP